MTSLAHLLVIPIIYTSILRVIPAAAYIPAQPVNDTSSLNFTDSSTISISWVDPAGVFSGPVSYQLEADVQTGGTTSGGLVHFVESSMGQNLTTSTPWIAYISCDVNESTASQEWDIFTLARDRGAVSALLYTATSASCLLNEDYIQNFEKPLDVFATKKVQTARLIDTKFVHTNDMFYTYNGTLLNESGNAINESIGGTPLSTRTYLIGTLAARNSTGQAMTSDIPSATSTSAPPSSHHPPDSMIALYVITGLISSMFLLIVLMGARRAARNPERYGRREGDDTQGPQSTAGGIAQAILDTFPVIKFNRSTSTTHERGFRGSQPKRLSSEGEPSSVVLPELNQVNHARQSLGVRSLEDDETFRTASEDFDESLKSGPTPSGSRRASGNHVAHRSMIDEVDADAAGDQCPICLLDFEEGDDLRVLPCEKEHVYHKACIDPWLLQVSGSCPLCRKDFNNPTPEPPSPSPTSSPNQRQPQTTSSFPKYLAFIRHESRSGRPRAGTVDSGVGPGRRREADQTGPGGY